MFDKSGCILAAGFKLEMKMGYSLLHYLNLNCVFRALLFQNSKNHYEIQF